MNTFAIATDEPLPDKLKRWRLARHLSLGALALKAGVHKSTLSYWESGKRQPSVIELDAVLQALHVPTPQRCSIWHHLDAPRAIHALRQEQVAFTMTGDLLKSMRQRRGMTQSAAASHVGVSRGAIAQWENGHTWPDSERLHRLCYALGASAEEVATLTTGRFVESRPASFENLNEELHDLLCDGSNRTPKDLSFLRLKSAFEQLEQSDTVLEALIHVQSRYAQYLHDRHRSREARHFIGEAARLVAQKKRFVEVFFPIHAVIVAVPGTHAARRASIDILQKGLTATRWGGNRSWMMMHLANYIADEGESTDGLRWMEASYREAHELHEVFIRRREWAALLVKCQRSLEALRLFPPSESHWAAEDNLHQSHDEIVWSEALWRSGEKNEARKVLAQATSRADRLGQMHDLPEAVRLTELFQIQ